MKRKCKIISFLLTIMLCMSMFSGNMQAANVVKLNKTSATLYVKTSTTLKITGTTKTVKWSTSNKNIADVSSKGKVTAKKKGIATITAKVSGKSYKCKVTVKNPYLNKKEVSLKKGKTTTIKLIGATASKYKSDNTKVATVNKKGKITAKSDGKATITCTDSNGKNYKCVVTVKSTKKKQTNTDKSDTNIGNNDSVYVWISETGSKYHSINNCGRMNPDKVYQLALNIAINYGYTPCSKCY